MIIRGLKLRRRHVADGLEQPPTIELVDPFERRVFGVQTAPRAAPVNDLGLVEPDDRLGERVVVGAASDVKSSSTRLPFSRLTATMY
jgi:hypothetical protein